MIRRERVLNAIRQYIIDNPVRWEFDRYNPNGGADVIEHRFWMETL